MFKGGENNLGDMGEDGVSIAASQSLANWDFTYEINLDLFPCNKKGKITPNVTLGPRHLTEKMGKSTSLEPRQKLTNLLVLGGGWYNDQYKD